MEKKIHMFSTSKKMNKLQIALQRNSGATWSKPFSLQQTEGILSINESVFG